MPVSTEDVLRQALQLPPNERAALVEGLIASLDEPRPSLDSSWLKEAESRMAAHRRGELAAIDAEQVFSELGRKI